MKIILAWDKPFLSPNDSVRFICLQPDFDMLKVGQTTREKFAAHSKSVSMQHMLIDSAATVGIPVFLDNKPSDIDRTMHEVMADMYLKQRDAGGVQMLTVRADMSYDAYQEVLNVCRPLGIKVVAVTLLTDIGDVQCRRMHRGVGPNQVVYGLGTWAKYCGAHGIVCSGRELPYLYKKDLFTNGFFSVIPGISSEDTVHLSTGRPVTVRQAADKGAHYIVVGSMVWNHPEGPKVGLQAIRHTVSTA